MSETIPGYGPIPDPPVIDRMALQARIAMYLHGRCGEPAARALLEEASLALTQAEQAIRYWRTSADEAMRRLERIERLLTGLIQRVEPVLCTIEGCISDGK